VCYSGTQRRCVHVPSRITKAPSSQVAYTTRTFTAKMFSTQVLYSGAALYATTSAFCAAWVCYALPAQHNRVGPFNYHFLGRRLGKGIERVPWRRLPKVL